MMQNICISSNNIKVINLEGDKIVLFGNIILPLPKLHFFITNADLDIKFGKIYFLSFSLEKIFNLF